MANAIGIRVYKISLSAKGSRKELPLNTPDVKIGPAKFLETFISKHKTPKQHVELERSWFFESKGKTSSVKSQGYIHYGTFGFESDFVDTKTQKKNYRRKVTDIEQIPLFYEIWFPKGHDYGFVVFQSFQSRSCVNIVMSEIMVAFAKANAKHYIRFKKLMPNDVEGSLYSKAPVKKLTLIRKSAPADLADRYFSSVDTTSVDFEVSITAKRRKNLGNYMSIKKGLPKGQAGIVVDGDATFTEAVATISIGGRPRRVGMFGYSGDAGVIDLSDIAVRGPDGHPTFESLLKESNAVLKDFHGVLSLL